MTQPASSASPAASLAKCDLSHEFIDNVGWCGEHISIKLNEKGEMENAVCYTPLAFPDKSWAHTLGITDYSTSGFDNGEPSISQQGLQDFLNNKCDCLDGPSKNSCMAYFKPQQKVLAEYAHCLGVDSPNPEYASWFKLVEKYETGLRALSAEAIQNMSLEQMDRWLELFNLYNQITDQQPKDMKEERNGYGLPLFTIKTPLSRDDPKIRNAINERYKFLPADYTQKFNMAIQVSIDPESSSASMIRTADGKYVSQDLNTFSCGGAGVQVILRGATYDDVANRVADPMFEQGIRLMMFLDPKTKDTKWNIGECLGGGVTLRAPSVNLTPR